MIRRLCSVPGPCQHTPSRSAAVRTFTTLCACRLCPFPELWHCPEQKLYPLSKISPQPLPQPLAPTTSPSVSRNLTKRSRTVFLLLCLAYFTEHNVFKVCACVRISFFCLNAVPSNAQPCSVCPPVHRWALLSFLVAVVTSSAVSVNVQALFEALPQCFCICSGMWNCWIIWKFYV